MTASRLGAEERALWAKVIATVRPLHPQPSEPDLPQTQALPPPPRPAKPSPKATIKTSPARPRPGETLDGSWDRRLARGSVQPDFTVDLHGHTLHSAYALLDHRLDLAIAAGARLLLLITGKPPRERPTERGKIRAAVGDWLAASRHAESIAAVRGAHPRHGGGGALYIVIRRRRQEQTKS